MLTAMTHHTIYHTQQSGNGAGLLVLIIAIIVIVKAFSHGKWNR